MERNKLDTSSLTFTLTANTLYITCSTHYFNYGIYLSEWATLRPTTHPHSFNIGDDNNANIPIKYLCHINYWSEAICNGILYSNKNFQIPDCDGYVFIHNLIKKDHPSFMHMPHLLILHCPKQLTDDSLKNFLYCTKHWLNMRSFIENSEVGINSATENDSFISLTVHRMWLHRQISHDCQNPNHAYKYKPGQLVGTLEQWFQELPKQTNKPYSNPYYNKHTNLIETDLITNNNDSDTNDPDNSPVLTNFPVNKHIIIATMDFIKKNPPSIKSPVCIFCKVINPRDFNHTFEECKLYQINNFCRYLAIDAVSFSNKVLNRQQVSFTKISEDQRDKTIQALKSLLPPLPRKRIFIQGTA